MKTFIFPFLMLLSLLTLAQVPTQGLVAFLPMNGDPADDQGFFQHFVTRPTTATVSPFADRWGNTSGACAFDADAYYKDSLSSGMMPDTAFTLAAWVNPSQVQWYSTIFGIRLSDVTTSYNSLWVGLVSDRKLQCAMTTTGQIPQQVVTSNTALPFNTWTHVAVSYSQGAAEVKIYINGDLEITQTVVPGTVVYPPSPNFTIGNHLSTAGTALGFHKFIGGIDELALYNRALTAQEIYAFEGIAAGRISHLPLNGNATDSKNFFQNFVTRPTTATVWPVNGHWGNNSGACSFDANAYYKDSVSIVTMPDTAFTLAAWVAPAQVQLYSTIFGIRLSDVTTSYNSLWLGLVSNWKLQFAMTTTGQIPQQDVTSTTALPLNAWTHVAVSYSQSAAEVKIYINGTLEVTQTVVPGTIVYPASPNFTIGNHLSTAGTPLDDHKFIGSLDEFALYNRALSASEIGTFVGIVASADAAPTAPAVRLIPNPAREVVQVQTVAHVQSIRLLDLTGKVIRESAETTVEVADLSAGLYLMQMQTAQGMAVERFVKE